MLRRGIVIGIHRFQPVRLFLGSAFSAGKNDFDSAIKWNLNNMLAYLELSRVYAALEVRDQAISVIERLLELKPDEDITQQAEAELEKLKSIESK